MSDEALQKHDLSGVVTFALKYRQMRDFAEFLEKILPRLELIEQYPQGLYLGKIVLQYILDGIEANDLPLFYQQINQHLHSQLKGEAMTLAECLRQQGLEEGMQQGIHQGETVVITRQLQKRFGVVPATYLHMISQADSDTLLQWGEKILDAHTLDEVFH